MGLLGNVLFGPVKLLTWTANQILEMAENELYDTQAIQEALVRLNEDYDQALVSDQDFMATEDALMERLEVARARGGP